MEKEWYYEVADSDGDSISDSVDGPQTTGRSSTVRCPSRVMKSGWRENYGLFEERVEGKGVLAQTGGGRLG